MLFLIQPRLMFLFTVSNQRFSAQKGKMGPEAAKVWHGLRPMALPGGRYGRLEVMKEEELILQSGQIQPVQCRWD